uniref:Large ribosomal subunit protein bL28c n=1 Tax=Cyanoptyche gloeocystis TaxID=77922 RepID=A0A3G1IW87_9EUKA|nr:ribosomal protein L28 [Cyanoptyche gloeocystis]
MSKKCQITGKKQNNAYSISHSHRRNKKIQKANLQKKSFWCTKTKRWIKMIVCTKIIKNSKSFL